MGLDRGARVGRGRREPRRKRLLQTVDLRSRSGVCVLAPSRLVQARARGLVRDAASCTPDRVRRQQRPSQPGDLAGAGPGGTSDTEPPAAEQPRSQSRKHAANRRANRPPAAASWHLLQRHRRVDFLADAVLVLKQHARCHHVAVQPFDEHGQHSVELLLLHKPLPALLQVRGAHRPVHERLGVGSHRGDLALEEPGRRPLGGVGATSEIALLRGDLGARHSDLGGQGVSSAAGQLRCDDQRGADGLGKRCRSKRLRLPDEELVQGLLDLEQAARREGAVPEPFVRHPERLKGGSEVGRQNARRCCPGKRRHLRDALGMPVKVAESEVRPADEQVQPLRAVNAPLRVEHDEDRLAEREQEAQVVEFLGAESLRVHPQHAVGIAAGGERRLGVEVVVVRRYPGRVDELEPVPPERLGPPGRPVRSSPDARGVPVSRQRLAERRLSRLRAPCDRDPQRSPERRAR